MLKSAVIVAKCSLPYKRQVAPTRDTVPVGTANAGATIRAESEAVVPGPGKKLANLIETTDESNRRNRFDTRTGRASLS